MSIRRSQKSSVSRGVFGNGYRRYFIRPCAGAGTRQDKLVALGCALMLAAILILEVATPDDVVGGLALLPLAAAMWMLSNRLAAVVMATGVLLFALALGSDQGNRPTLLLIAIPVLVTAGFVRIYAVSLAGAALIDGSKKRNALASFGAPGLRTHALPQLTIREFEVARLAARAYTAAEIGKELHIGERTVESHIATTYLKLGIRSRPELIRLASSLG